MMERPSTALWAKIIVSKDPLSGFEGKATLYKEPFEGKTDRVCWFYDRATHCQVFFACSNEVADLMFEESWADVSSEFTVYVEQELFPACVQNTAWNECEKFGIDYTETVMIRDQKGRFSHKEKGCEGSTCWCEPFGHGDFTYGEAEESEFKLDM